MATHITTGTTSWRIVYSNCTRSINYPLSNQSWIKEYVQRLVDECITSIERERRARQLIRAMAKAPIERAPRLGVALNAGMQLRRMRASSGLARART